MEKKYHFIYLTTSKFNGKYYIGMHSTDDLNDGYFGSGKKLLEDVEKYGLSEYETRILKFCDSRDDLINNEKEIVTPEIINNWYCLNMIVGGDVKINEYYVNSFNIDQYNKIYFKIMIKDDEIVNVISILIPLHIKLGWKICDEKDEISYREKLQNNQFSDKFNYNQLRKGNGDDFDEIIVKEQQTKWYLQRGWVKINGPEECKVIIKENKLRSDIFNRLLEENKLSSDVFNRLLEENKNKDL